MVTNSIQEVEDFINDQEDMSWAGFDAEYCTVYHTYILEEWEVL